MALKFRSSLTLHAKGMLSTLRSLSVLLLASDPAASFNPAGPCGPHLPFSIDAPIFANRHPVAFNGQSWLGRSSPAMADSVDKHLDDILGDWDAEWAEPEDSKGSEDVAILEVDSEDSPGLAIVEDSTVEDEYFVELHQGIESWLDSALEGERRKRKSLKKEAEAALDAERLGHWAELVKSNLYRIDGTTERIVVEDWNNDCAEVELQFDLSKGTPLEQAEKAFAKARKMRRGSKVLAELIEKSEKCERQIQTWKETLRVDNTDVEELEELRRNILSGAKKKFKLKTGGLESIAPKAEESEAGAIKMVPAGGQDAKLELSFAPPEHGIPGGVRLTSRRHAQNKWTGREFTSPHGIPILVGRNRRENDLLSVQVARDPDVWFHVRDQPGAHVVLQMSRVVGKVEPSEMCMQMAADLAAFYSEGSRETKARVVFTNPKHVIKRKGMPLGAVQLRKEEGTLLGRPQDSIYIPDEIMESRDRERFGANPNKLT